MIKRKFVSKRKLFQVCGNVIIGQIIKKRVCVRDPSFLGSGYTCDHWLCDVLIDTVHQTTSLICCPRI